MKTLRIFISSPGDVAEERERARMVVETLQRRYAGVFLLKTVLWEELPLQADMSFQEGIDLVLSREQGIDIAVFVLWSRLGSPLGVRVRKADGGEYRSGTEREFDLMLEARRQSGGKRPAVLAYTRQDEASFEERLRGKATAEKEDMIAQKRLVERFIAEEFHEAGGGHNMRAYHSFDRPQSFAQRLRAHLVELLDEMAQGAVGQVVWDIEEQGPPFMGLEAFGPEQAQVFCGRDGEVVEARRALAERAREGCAFLLLSGASGSGKSSLARAGLVPAIVEHELDETVAEWRVLSVTPSELGEEMVGGLVRRLAEPGLLPGLRMEDRPLGEVAALLGSDAQKAVALVIKPAVAEAARRRGGGVRVLLVVDQMEELFARAAEPREVFLGAVEALARSGVVWVVGTLRGDFLGDAQGSRVLARLLGGGGLLPVVAPDTDGLRHIIEEPARLAGLRFEEKEGRSLGDRILADAARHADLLPLVEYVLRELYDQRTASGVLTWAAYEALGGVEGALARRADAALAGLPAAAQAALPTVLKRLVSVSEVQSGGEDGSERLIRQRVELSEFAAESPARSLVEAFIRERLFTAASGGQGQAATVSLAHEALLRVWPTAAAWAEQNRDLLRTRARVAARMRESARIAEGDPLLEAARLALMHDAEAFSAEQADYIRASHQAAEAARLRREKLRRRVLAGLTTLTLLALAGAGWALKREQDAKHSEAKAEDQLKETRRQLERSQIEEGRAWLERAKVAWEGEKNPLKALMLAGRAVGFHGLGRGKQEDARVEPVYPHLLGKPMSDPVNETTRQREFRAVLDYALGIQPTGLPIWSSPVRAHHRLGVTSVAFSPDGSRLASGSLDGTVKLWEVATGREIATLQGHGGDVSSVAFSPDGSRLASGSEDGTVKLWEVATGREIATLQGHGGVVSSVAFSPDGSRLASGSWDDTVKLWEVATGREIATLQGHKDSVTSVAFSPDGSRLASGSWDDTVKLWEVATGREIATLQGHKYSVSSVAFSPDGSRLASGSEDGTVKLWEVATGRENATLQGHENFVYSVAFSPDGSLLASGSEDDTVKLWEVATGRELATLQGHGGGVSSVAFSPDGSRLASGSWDDTVKLWEVATGRELATLQGHGGDVYSVAFSPDGSLLASGSADGTVKLWEVATGRELATLQGHGGDVYSVAFSPDGSLLASGSEDRTVKLWEVATGREIATLQGHKDSVSSVAFSPDGSRLASGSWDDTVKLWEVATGRELSDAPDFPLDPKQNPSQGIEARPEGSLVRLVPMNASLDLLALQRGGYLKLADREVEWATNPSLLTTLSFQPIHWRPDLVAQLAAADSQGERLVLRLRLCGRGGQWRALLPMHAEIPRLAADQQAGPRREFCLQAVIALRGLVLETAPQAPADLWQVFLETWEPGHWADPSLSLPLAQAVPALLALPEPPDAATARLLDRFPAQAPRAWLEAVASACGKKVRQQDLPPSAKERVIAFIRGCQSAHPESLPILRKALRTYAPTDSGWLETVRALLAHPEALAKDFTDAAYAAAKVPTLHAVCKDILEQAEQRFPQDASVHRLAGWCLINLGDPRAALRAFEAARGALKPEEKPGSDLLAGLALAQWLNERREEAISTYKQLIEAGRGLEQPTDWADPETIRKKGWPEAETRPLEALRAVTLEKHPELGPEEATEEAQTKEEE